jgi:hypothetical protein
VVEHQASILGVAGSIPAARLLSAVNAILFTELKTQERNRARKLRAERGYSINQIAALLQVSPRPSAYGFGTSS